MVLLSVLLKMQPSGQNHQTKSNLLSDYIRIQTLSNIHQHFSKNSPDSKFRIMIGEASSWNTHTGSSWPPLTGVLPRSTGARCILYILISLAGKDYKDKKRVHCKTLFISGPLALHVNHVLQISFSTETMECYTANNKVQALIKYPIHNSIEVVLT